MAKKTPSAQPRRKPRLLWANPFCLLDTSSGASMTVRQMLHQLLAQGYEVQVLGATIFDDPRGTEKLREQFPDLEAKLHQLVEAEDDLLTHQLVVTHSTTRSHLTAHEAGLWYSQYLYLLDHFKPDLVWFYGGQTLDMLIPDEARARGIPAAFYLANGNYQATRWCRDVDLVLTDSRATADMYRKRVGFACTPVGKFIDPTGFVAAQHERKRLLYVNPSWEKGASVAVQLAVKLEQHRPDIKIEVVEARADWASLLQETTRKLGQERRNLSNVIVTPNTSDMRGPYSRARALLAPSLWWESSGRVLAEAMLNGIPALVSNRGGMPEMVGDAGIAFDFPKGCYEAPYQQLLSDEELQPLMDAVLAFYDDESLYQDYVARAKSVGEQNHGLDKATERLLAAFAPLVKQRAGDRDYAAYQRKRHRQNLVSVAGKPSFRVDESFRRMVQARASAPHAQPASSLAAQFDWQLKGKLIVLDNRAKLLRTDIVNELAETGAFGIVAFDPASEVAEPQQYEGSESIQVFQHALLGDGKPATLYACIAPELTSTLAPLPAEQTPEHRRQQTQVITKLPINTIALDNIDGLASLDWLILDELSDAATVLNNGKKALKDSLLIQARVTFQPTHENQPSLAELQHWASRNGFRFYRLNDISHYSHFPEKLAVTSRQATEQESADALFLPSFDRMASLTSEQKTKLAFLLHTVFGAKDIAYQLLAEVDKAKAAQYLLASGLVKKEPMTTAELAEHVKGATLEPVTASHSLPGHLVVSLTSYQARFDNLHLTLRSLILQDVGPDLLVLWIANEEKHLLPQNVWDLVEYGLQIRFCEDIRSYKKIIPTLREYPDSFVVTADDDIYYEPAWLKGLIASWDNNDKTIVAHRAHKIRLDGEGRPVTYRNWKWQVNATETADGLIFPTSGAGVLYPPHVFHPEVVNAERAMELCPTADDIWLYWMASLNGARAKRSDYDFRIVEWPNQGGTSLWKNNIVRGGNDRSVARMLETFGSCWSTDHGHLIRPTEFSVAGYWDRRYRKGGNSGAGSYGRLARFKAEVINGFIEKHGIDQVIEFGCGDGHQLSLMTSVEYLGVDISPTAVQMCQRNFFDDNHKTFCTVSEFDDKTARADLTLSLDVIYHLIDDSIYNDYMNRLFACSNRYCIIYSANKDESTPAPHVRKRRFTDWIEENAPGWKMIRHIPNKYPMTPSSDPNNTSFADFYVFERGS